MALPCRIECICLCRYRMFFGSAAYPLILPLDAHRGYVYSPPTMLIEANPLAALQEFVVAKGSQKTAAAELGVSPSFLNDILQGHRQVSDKILNQLNLRRAVIRETRKGGKP